MEAFDDFFSLESFRKKPKNKEASNNQKNHNTLKSTPTEWNLLTLFRSKIIPDNFPEFNETQWKI